MHTPVLLASDLDDQFASIRSVEKHIHRRGRTFQAFYLVHSVLESAFLVPLGKGLYRFGCAVPVIEHQESFHACTFHHQLHEIARTGWNVPTLVCNIVAGNHAADRYSPLQIQKLERRFKHFPAYIVKVHVYAARTLIREGFNERPRAIVDRPIETKLLCDCLLYTSPSPRD